MGKVRARSALKGPHPPNFFLWPLWPWEKKCLSVADEGHPFVAVLFFLDYPAIPKKSVRRCRPPGTQGKKK
ncbi:hypothetical protein [Pandoravirus japonicus]|uniref:Uncharacterized protein n=1 Tax=Pandoravirus japonicus TaxID=2823154 RepID=A0A811BRB4_9VIRU|nr:hypothetical protein [Pandoravirus japonicus]